MSFKKYKDYVDFILDSYVLEATPQPAQAQNQANAAPANIQQIPKAQPKQQPQQNMQDIMQSQDDLGDDIFAGTDAAGMNVQGPEEDSSQVVQDLDKLKLLNKIKYDISFYTRLKSIVFSSTKLISKKVNQEILMKIEEIELLFNYVLINFKKISTKDLEKIVQVIENGLEEVVKALKH